jgi:hypothetical protein
MDPRAGLDDVEKSKFLTVMGLELRSLGRPASSQSLCRLSYPGSKGDCIPSITFQILLGSQIEEEERARHVGL